MATPLISSAPLAPFPAASEATILTPTPPPDPRPSSPSHSQRYCLKWNNYQSNVTSTFKELLAVEDFVDITLMAEGGALRAHKVVLSACSPYFRDILKGIAAWQHPVIVLKDVPYSHLQGIVEFIYHGEVSVDQNSLDSFLKAAQLLRVKGLTDEAILNNNPHSSQGEGGNQRMSMLPARTHLHHPRKSLRPTRAIIKRDLVQNEDFVDQDEDGLVSPSKRLTTSSSGEGESKSIINEINQSNEDHLKARMKEVEEVDVEDEEEEIDDVEDEELESGDEEEEEVPPFINHSQGKSNSLRSQSEWDQSDERKQRQQMMMGGGDLSIVPVGLNPKFFDQTYGLSQHNFLCTNDENSMAIPSTSCDAGSAGAAGSAGQKKTCPYCYQQLSWHALSRHVRDMHRAKTGYVTCKFCFKMFRNKNSLGCHMWRFHKDAKDQQQPRGDTPPGRGDESIPIQN